MKYIYFEKAGNDLSPNCQDSILILCSRHRKTKKDNTIFHNNKYNSCYRFPESFFKANFRYDRNNKQYHTSLRIRQCRQYLTVCKAD